jgi:hypothetical protein
VAHKADDQQVGFLFFKEGDNGRDGVAGDHHGIEFDAFFLRHRASLLQRRMIFMILLNLGLDYFVDRGRHVGHLLDRDHVQRRRMLLGKVARQGQRLQPALRAVIGDHDMFEHGQTSCLARPIFGKNHFCAITVGTTALPMTVVSKIVYCSWLMM